MDGELQPVTNTPATTAATDRDAPKNLTLAAGSLKLSDGIRPGIYDLEVAVKDTLVKKPVRLCSGPISPCHSASWCRPRPARLGTSLRRACVAAVAPSAPATANGGGARRQ
jgi:hypothetical protein